MLPLDGMRVVDLADEKGELCGRLLADLGADVLRIEGPGGAVSRQLPPFAPDAGPSLYFALRNAGKRSLGLDVSDAATHEALHALLAEADVLIESHAPGFLANLGLAPAALIERYPHLVVTSITEFGQTGPYRDFVGTEMTGFAMGGLMHRAGIPEKPPLVAPGSLAYDTAGTTAAYATLVAYWRRLQTGRGQHVDVSVMESTANLSDWALPNYSASGAVGGRAGTGVYSLYRCADGFVRMIVLVERHWRALLDWMGNPEELADPALDNFIQRLIRIAEIEPVVERFFANKAKVVVACEAQARGIAATPLLLPPEVLENEHTVARGTFCDLEIAPGLVARAPSGFLSIDGERIGPRGPSPEFDSGAGEGFRPRRSSKAAAPPAVSPDGYPFRGIRVIDFGVGAVGVEVGRLLAEYGADVVKVETRTAPDFIRIIMGGFMNPNFASSNRSKRSFGVDCKTEAGRKFVQRLVEEADVVIENTGTGVMERLGLDYETLSGSNAALVMFSSQLVGSSGPWKNWIGYGPSAHAASGLQYLWNYPEDADRPAGSTNVYPDHYVGRLGAFAVVAALIRRLETGRGAHIDAAQFESVIQLLGDVFALESLTPGGAAPLGNERPRGVPWGVYRCAGDDEWCAVTVRDDVEWRALCEVIGRPQWAAQAEYRDRAGRAAHRAKIDAALEDWTSQRPPREAMEALQARGIPAGIVAHAAHHAEDPHLAARGYHKAVAQQDLGDVVLEGTPFLASDLPPPITTQAPRLGEHTREIGRERLGLTDAELDAWVEAGVLEDPP